MLDKFRETAITWDKASRKVYESLRVSAGDNKGRKLFVQVVNGGVIENLSGASLSLFWETKDKAHKGLDAFTAVDATKGEFEIYYTTGMLSNKGILNANLVLVNASGRIVSEPFTITVFKGINDDAIQSSDSFTALTEALAKIHTNFDGSPSIFFDTLAALQAAYPQGTDGVALVRETNPAKIYVWHENKWNDFGDYQGVEIKDRTISTSKLAEKAVTTNKTAFLNAELAEDSIIDIMPESLSPIGDFYDPENGNFSNGVYTQNFKNTGKIYLTEKGEIESYGNNSLVFFDASDTFISSTQHGSDVALPVKRRISPPENASYFIANVPKPYWWDSDDPTYPNLTASLSFIPEKTTMPILRVTEENFQKVVNPNFKPIEISDKFNISEDGKMIDVNNGSEINNVGRKHSDWQEVEDVEYRTYGVAHVLFKDSDGIFIKTVCNFNNDEALATWQTWKPPAKAKYMAFNVVTYYYDKFEFFQMDTSKLVNYIPNLNSVDSDDKKLIVDFGDSIIAANGYPSDISTIVAHELNANVINMGFGGTRAASHPNTHFNNFSLHKLVDAIVSKDFSAQEASSLVTGISMPAYFKTKVTKIKTIDFSKVDIIKISYGTNDWNGVVTVEDPSNPLNPTTYMGALRYSVKKLLEEYPHLKIVLTTPIYRFATDGSKDSDDWVAGDKKLTDFVDAVFSLGKELKLPVISCYHDLGINKYNRMQYFYSGDGTHVNYKGRKLLGHKHARGIKNAY